MRPHRRQPTRLLRPWDSLGKNTGVGCHFLLQCMKVKSESEVAQRVRLFATPWTAAYQAPPSMWFSRQEYWSGVPSPKSSFFFCRTCSLLTALGEKKILLCLLSLRVLADSPRHSSTYRCITRSTRKLSSFMSSHPLLSLPVCLWVELYPYLYWIGSHSNGIILIYLLNNITFSGTED